jgi:protein-tyrosine phosphatase
MAAALFGAHSRRRGSVDEVHSRGLLPGGEPAPAEAGRALTPYGLDLSDHRSRRLEVADVAGADLVLGMTRQHVREIVLLDPDALAKTFTVREVVRRGAGLASRRPDEDPVAWLRSLHRGRDRLDLVGRAPDDDTADPFGRPAAVYAATAAELAELTGRLATLLWPVGAAVPPT